MHCEVWTLWFTVVCDVTQMTCTTETEAAKYTQVLSLEALNLLVNIQTPVGPYYQAIVTFLRLHDHPMHACLEYCLFNSLSSLICASLQVILRRVRPLSTPLK